MTHDLGRYTKQSYNVYISFTLQMYKLETNINSVKLVLSLNIDHYYQAAKPSTIHVDQAWQNH